MSDSKTNTSMETGVSIVEDPAGSEKINVGHIQLQEVGLQVLLLGLAEQQAKRVKKLSSVLEKLENDIFDEDTIEHLSRSEKIEAYQLAMNTIGTCSSYIKGTVNNVDWNSLEVKMATILPKLENAVNRQENEGFDSDHELRDVANTLLKELGGKLK